MSVEVCTWCEFPTQAEEYTQKCICQPWWKKTNETLMNLKCTNKNITDRYYPSPLFVSTDTSISYLKGDTISVTDNKGETKQQLIDLQILLKARSDIVSYSPDTKSTKVSEYTKRGKPKQKFFNQATINIDIDGRNISNMIFFNGIIKIAGARHPLDCIRVVKRIIEIISEAHIQDEDGTKRYCVSNAGSIYIDKIDIVLINTNLDIGFYINQDKLAQDLPNDPNVKEVTPLSDKKKYHGVICKYYTDPEHTTVASIHIFHKGSIIITGIKNILHTKPAYDFITNFLYSGIEKYKLSTEMLDFNNIS
jgi:TATA-box binding protein (TBP) (component of TFIID and TFIIIB)